MLNKIKEIVKIIMGIGTMMTAIYTSGCVMLIGIAAGCYESIGDEMKQLAFGVGEATYEMIMSVSVPFELRIAIYVMCIIAGFTGAMMAATSFEKIFKFTSDNNEAG